jgi:Flp pilus assembly protein TadG
MTHDRILRKTRVHRRGSMGVLLAVTLVVVIGLGALAIDSGYLCLTKTQMQAANDAAALAGGTELLSGLGAVARKTPEQVAAAASTAAVQFAAANRDGDVSSAYVAPERDLFFGKAVFDSLSGTWQQSYGTTPYNMITAVLHRDQPGSTQADGPLGLFFARAVGRATQNLQTRATAVILPAKGYKVEQGGGPANIMPFAYRQKVWERLEQAQQWYYQPTRDGLTPTRTIPTTYYPGKPGYPLTTSGEPMFHNKVVNNKGNVIYVQDIFDNYKWNESTGTVSSNQRDGWLEVNIYPQDSLYLSSGNSGTIDLGQTNNAATEISRQIVEGLNADDFAAMADQGLLNADGELVLDPVDDPTWVNADPGISASIVKALEAVVGLPKAIALFDSVTGGGGNTASVRLTKFVGTRMMYPRLSSNPKVVWVQMAPVLDGTAVADYEGEVGINTTVFSPLILIE